MNEDNFINDLTSYNSPLEWHRLWQQHHWWVLGKSKCRHLKHHQQGCMHSNYKNETRVSVKVDITGKPEHDRGKATKSGNEEEYRHLWTLTTCLIQTAKLNHYKESIESHAKITPQLLCNEFRELCHKTTTEISPAAINFESKTLKGDSEIAEAFTKHFTGVADKLISW